jgi:hypothetical protein
MELAANCKDWARRRQRKAPAKMHLRLDPHNFLPSVAIVDTADQQPRMESADDNPKVS